MYRYSNYIKCIMIFFSDDCVFIITNKLKLYMAVKFLFQFFFFTSRIWILNVISEILQRTNIRECNSCNFVKFNSHPNQEHCECKHFSIIVQMKTWWYWQSPKEKSKYQYLFKNMHTQDMSNIQGYDIWNVAKNISAQ